MPRFTIRKLQWARRGVQLSILAAIIAIPLLARYSNYLASRELDKRLEKWEGTPQGQVLGTVDRVLRSLPGGEKERVGRQVRDDATMLGRLQSLRGNAWSAQIGPVTVTDPLAAAESIAATRHAVRALLLSLLIPLAVTLLLGRVFCSWLCPMGLLLELTARLRSLLRFLELPAFNVRFPRATKYVVLLVGLALAAFWGAPVLGSLYPPAVIGREARGAVTAFFDRAEGGVVGWTLAGLGLASLFIVGIALFELVVSERWWCRTMCPGGALYSLLGRFRPLRVRRDPIRCTECGDCVRVCPMGLAPMKDAMGMECDSCGVCISHCGDKALGYRFSMELPVLQRSSVPVSGSRKTSVGVFLAGFLAAMSIASAPLHAHHILGIPHYAYDESYPQAPVITYRTEAGDYDVKMTGYPGRPVPGERTSLHVYIAPRGAVPAFEGKVTLRVLRDGLFGVGDAIYGPVEAERSEGLFKFFPVFDVEDNFLVRIDYSVDGVPWTIDLPMVVGEPGSPLVTVALFAGGILALLIVIRAVRIKLSRRASAEDSARADERASGVPANASDGLRREASA